MKPVNLNQLLFHPKTHTLSFFQSPIDKQTEISELDVFLSDMQTQLQLQGHVSLATYLEQNLARIKKIVRSHPEKSHGFFISEELQGYIILDNVIETYSIMGSSFHVRPILEELFVNPEFLLVNVSLYDVKVYRGDFYHVEIVDHFEFDDISAGVVSQNSSRIFAPQYLGLIPYKNMLAMKNIVHKVIDLSHYHSLPVILTGLQEMKDVFLRYTSGFQVIAHFSEDFYERTCVEIQGKCRQFRPSILDYYSHKLKNRILMLSKLKRILTDVGEIIQASREGKVIQLVLPNHTKLWGKVNFENGEFEIHKKRMGDQSVDILSELADQVMNQDGQILFLGNHFFPADAHVLAVIKG